MEGLLALDDDRLLDVRIGGAKSAALCAAQRAGLPVLPGYVVPTCTASAALASAAEVCAARGSGGARQLILREAIDCCLADDLHAAVRCLGGDVIVRSSAVVEDDGDWAGAFTSFAAVGVNEVGTAVKGVWASTFGVHVLEHAAQRGFRPGELPIAVLVQPRVEPCAAGLARATADTVEIFAVAESPARLLAGQVNGERILVTDRTGASATVGGLTGRDWYDVAELAREARRVLGHGVVEWAWVDGRACLLQSRRERSRAVPSDVTTVALDELAAPIVDGVARLVLAFPGSLCEELVLPWALGLNGAEELLAMVGPRHVTACALDVDAARAASAQLASSVWRLEPAAAIEAAKRSMRGLRGPSPRAALESLQRLARPCRDEAVDLLSTLVSAGIQATIDGRIRAPHDIFDCEVNDVSRSGKPFQRQSWAGARRWEPFLASVSQSRGISISGTPAADSIGAGRARVVRQVLDVPTGRRPREVIITPRPAPELAPLLWDAAGLVTVEGSSAAHLVEVARSLGVATVVGCRDLPSFTAIEGALVAVDGTAGIVSIHRLDRAPSSAA